jgi:hypothetical protein
VSAPAVPTPTVVEQQRESVTRCLAALAEALGLDLTGFDWPCACGRKSDECTLDENGLCDG